MIQHGACQTQALHTTETLNKNNLPFTESQYSICQSYNGNWKACPRAIAKENVRPYPKHDPKGMKKRPQRRKDG
eukprot:CAMPEP_0113647432 /NCGR_PEP_ID=MMETSP0017_2-20120614/25103_1 /TAXON_ID=2856 /ORGANISM="Cylindrotheca closterium" /LENGTH=73 /DNA_ID=CAMNT_0000559479 /DNA_START=302 /DNA_END=523 /DNA_ORIENTATION=+ /assembly_acc=CAM_ASM_000147